MIPRGIRNNNPLNIRRTPDKWQGLMQTQTDSEFFQFKQLEYGWRAAFCLLTRTYYTKYGLDTIRKIVSRWAPPSENNTQSYISAVSRITGIVPDEPLGNPSEHPAHWLLTGAAMAIQENGISNLDYLSMLRGWELCYG